MQCSQMSGESGPTSKQATIEKKQALFHEFYPKFVDLEKARKSPDWSDQSLANGYPSLILLLSQLSVDGLTQSTDQMIHECVLRLKLSIERQGILNLSLFGGATGIAFALSKTKYRKMLDSVHRHILENLDQLYLAKIKKNLLNKQSSFAKLYDPILGVCGIGRYLLEHLALPQFEAYARQITKILIELTNPIEKHGTIVPGWYMPPDDPLNKFKSNNNAHGNFNLGLAHGITGILSYLTISLARGIEVEGQRDAITRIAHWVQSKAQSSSKGIVWPYSVSFAEEVTKPDSLQEGSRDAWCYGSPGICRTLFLAGAAINDIKLQKIAQKTFQDVFLRSHEEWQLPGPTLCHGIAGLLLITEAMNDDIHAQKLRKLLLTYLNPDSKWGFKDAVPIQGNKFNWVDNPGFLEGAAGVWLTLISQSRDWALPLMIDV